MDTSMFEQIASSITVKSICDPLGPDVPATSAIPELEEYLDPSGDPTLDPFNNPSRVVDCKGHIVGMLWFEDWTCLGEPKAADETITVEQVMERIEPNEYVSSGTTILDAVDIFGARHSTYFYVIDRNKVIGVLRYRNLFKPLGRLAFLALALEIEDQALSLCQSPSLAERCWLSISYNRRQKAIELYKQRHDRESEKDFRRLIECTNLIDKATMIWKQQLIASATRTEVLGFFNDLQTIRNRCAHAGNEWEHPMERLAQFIDSAKRMRGSLRESMEAHGIVPGRIQPVPL